MAERAQKEPALGGVRSALRIEDDGLVPPEGSFGQLAEWNPLRGGNVECFEVVARPNVDNPEAGAAIPDPFGELERGYMIVLVFDRSRELSDIDACASRAVRSSRKDCQRTGHEGNTGGNAGNARMNR